MIVEIIVIGNEILTGHTLDTNSQYLAKKITEMGGQVRRIIKVPDAINEIADAINYALSHRPDFIITTGGLGPTFDDKTAQAVAVALGVPLVRNQKAYVLIRDRYLDLYQGGIVDSYDMTPPREKMADLPEGVELIQNRVGTAPGFFITKDNTTIICLPGVPNEMKDMFERDVVKLLQQKAESLVYKEYDVAVDITDETKLAPIVRQVMEEFPGIYVKSHPTGFSKKGKIVVTISVHAKDENEANDILKKAVERLLDLVYNKLSLEGP
ncbi:MAG: competence/damage-inducible protein A [Candidatus Asgardarchaeia archaeon]